MHLSHSVNRVGSQLQAELGYMHPPFLKYANKVKLSTGAGLLVLVRDGTKYPLKMVIGTYLLISKNVVQHVYLLIVFICR